MITTYEVTALDAVTAIRIAQNRARADGFHRSSVIGTRQLGTNQFWVELLVSR